MARERSLRWTERAEQDIEEHHRRLASRSAEAARRFAGSVLDALDPLPRFPHLGVVARDLRPLGVYRAIACQDARIIYRVDETTIWILRVWIGRRDPRDLDPE